MLRRTIQQPVQFMIFLSRLPSDRRLDITFPFVLHQQFGNLSGGGPQIDLKFKTNQLRYFCLLIVRTSIVVQIVSHIFLNIQLQTAQFFSMIVDYDFTRFAFPFLHFLDKL
jgi:hypothetical protein